MNYPETARARRERYSLVRTAPPASEPVTLAEAKLHARVDPDQVEEDGLFVTLIAAAREFCETTLMQSLVTSSWRLSLDLFPPAQIEIPLSPLISVESVQYRDVGDGVLTTLSTDVYEVDTDSPRGRVVLAWGQAWPGVRYGVINAVQVNFTAGHGAAADVPARVKQAVLMLVSHWYENRETVVTGTITTEMKVAVEALLFNQWTGTY